MIDASALVELLLRTERGTAVERAIGSCDLVAPDLVNPEVVHSLRGLERSGKLTALRASTAIMRLAESNIARVPTRILLQDVWVLRANLTAYDACYVALARLLHCMLLTTEKPLARAPNIGVPLIVV